MTITDKEIESFLVQQGFTEFRRISLVSDASFRRYERIDINGGDIILMIAPPEKENIKPFIKIDEILISLGLSAPKIIARNIEKGLILLEDFGNAKFNQIMKESPNSQAELYVAATDVLIKLYKKRQKFDLPNFSKEKFINEALLFCEWYLPLFEKFDENKTITIKSEFKKILENLFSTIKLANNVIVLFDYHSENLMLLEEKNGVEKVGILDFQDAVMGNPSYDLVSLLEDARRDVSKELQQKTLQYYIEKTSDYFNKEDFINDYNIFGAQRNLRILGVFSRLKVRDGKESYLKYIPRVKDYLKQDLQHESLKELKEFMSKEFNI